MKIAILGYGVEGESVYKYYHAKFPDAQFVAYDNNEVAKNPLPVGVEFVGGVSDFKGIDADLAIKTPAIAPWLVEVSGEVTTMTREFMKVCPAPIIGVTGTKGKGTTASLIKSILDAAGKKTWLVGNIGVGAFDVLDQIQPDDVVVYELSSFQLWDIDVSPSIAVILAIEPEHLDVHKSFDDYLAAKANIRIHQGIVDDICFYHPTNKYAAQIALKPENGDDDRSIGEWNWNAFKYNAKNIRDDSVWVARYEDDGFYASKGDAGDFRICDLDAIQLPGKHNLENATAAISAAMRFTDDFVAIEEGLRNFSGLPHRLKFVREVNGVRYYDDSIATTPGSAIAALAAFEQPKVIILGGSYKGATYDELAAKVAESSIRKILLIGSEAPKIETAIKAQGITDYENLGSSITMADIVGAAKNAAEPGDVVILSPACASFDMFKSYSDRGDQFIQAVQRL
jgi:UDP-N-acetylmuramoylalanine--D-glutamate ligase